MALTQKVLNDSDSEVLNLLVEQWNAFLAFVETAATFADVQAAITAGDFKLVTQMPCPPPRRPRWPSR